MVAEPRRLVYRCDRRGVGNASSGNLIVQPPADVLGIGLAPVAPPGVGVAGGGRVQLAVDIDQAPTLCRTVQGSCRCNGDGYRSLLKAGAAEPALPGRRRGAPLLCARGSAPSKARVATYVVAKCLVAKVVETQRHVR